MVVGSMLIARRGRAQGAPLGFDLLSAVCASAGTVDLIYWAVQVMTGRDCFAFLFMVLTLVGLERRR